MTKILFQFDKEKISKAYNKSYLDELKKKYNNYLEYEGVTKVELVICSRENVNRSTDLQPKLYTISPNDVNSIAQLFRAYDYSLDCEPQLITNRSSWDDSVLKDEDELLAGFKRDRAQNILKKEKIAFVDNEDMIYLRLYFSDVKAFMYIKTLSNVVSPNENKQPNSPSDIVLTLEDCIDNGSLPQKLYQLKNRDKLRKEIKCLTPDKNTNFRTEVENKFYSKTNKDVRYEIIYSGNIDDICNQRGLPKSGESFKYRNSIIYYTNSGEMKTTWYNACKKLLNVEEPCIDILFYVGKPVNLPKERFHIIRELLLTYKYFNQFKPQKNMKSIIRCLGFHTQAKQGLPYLKGNKEFSKTTEIPYVLRHPFHWFHVTNKKEMKKFIENNLSNIEKKYDYIKQKNGFGDFTNQLYVDIMRLYDESILDITQCAA
tara:strand:+ start:152 stop:1438 length:1287 start_codon:yes stop_codon:yes gene_type:complete